MPTNVETRLLSLDVRHSAGFGR